MTTAIEQPKQQPSAEDIAKQAITRVADSAKAETLAKEAIAKAATPGLDAQDFVRANRVHVKDGSLFVDPYLVLHPHELKPDNEAALRDKLRLTYSLNHPSFYESPERYRIALNLSKLVPVSLAAKQAQKKIGDSKLARQMQTGIDEDFNRELVDKRHPMASVLRDTMKQPETDPIGMETLKNGLTIYLLMREKLTKNGYLNKLSSYVTRNYTLDQVLSDLSEKVGITPLALREAAAKGGIDAVGDALGLDKAYVQEAKQVAEQAVGNEFSYNRIAHWHLGRQQLGASAPMEQKITTGLEQRITKKIEDFRRDVKHYFEVPEPIKAEEKRVADLMNFLDPVQRMVMFKQGYELGSTPEFLADDIAFYRDVFGVHRTNTNSPRDLVGTRRIYVSGHGDPKAEARTFVHEAAHNLAPNFFTAEEAGKIDALLASDSAHFKKLDKFLNEQGADYDKLLHAYQKGAPETKAAVAQTIKERAQQYGIAMDDAALPYLRDARDLKFIVDYALQRLDIDGKFFNRSGYTTTDARFREMISRFAELKQVEYRTEPQLLHFLAPGFDAMWQDHYIPHLKRVYQALQKALAGAATHAAVDETVAGAEVARAPVPKPEGAAADHCLAPLTQVDAGSITHTPETLAAMNALSAMGVHVQQR